jgi:hypothetical protein
VRLWLVCVPPSAASSSVRPLVDVVATGVYFRAVRCRRRARAARTEARATGVRMTAPPRDANPTDSSCVCVPPSAPGPGRSLPCLKQALPPCLSCPVLLLATSSNGIRCPCARRQLVHPRTCSNTGRSAYELHQPPASRRLVIDPTNERMTAQAEADPIFG